MSAKLLVVGSVNMDLLLRMKRMVRDGESLIGEEYAYIPGGKGANAAVAAARLDARVGFVGAVGEDANGPVLLENMRREGIDVTHSRMIPGQSSGLAVILLDNGGKNRILVYPGANMALTCEMVTAELIDQYDAVMLQMESPRAVIAHTVAMARERGRISVMDAGPAQDYPLEQIQGVTILSPNETETLALTGVLPDTLSKCEEAAVILTRRAQCEYVVLKLGGRGCYVHGQEIRQLIEPPSVEAVDPTAAGDAFTGALAQRYVQTYDILQSARYANAVGALTVTRLGAQPSLPTWAQLQAFMTRG